MFGTMNNSVKTAVIVVNYNGRGFLDRCLDSLRCQTFSHFQIIVVDNASNDGSADGIEERFLGIEVIRSGENIGFAAANNLAVQRVEGCKWIALLNPDAFAEPDWLLNLHRAAKENPQYSFFGSHMKQYGSPGRLDGTGDTYHLCGLAWRRARPPWTACEPCRPPRSAQSRSKTFCLFLAMFRSLAGTASGKSSFNTVAAVTVSS